MPKMPKMKAAVFVEPGRIVLEEKPVPDVGPLTVNHLGQLPAVTLSFNLKSGVSLGEATKAVEDVAGKIMPTTVQRSFQGTAQAFQQSFSNMGILLAAAIVVIYIVLGILYESFIHPITILSGLPSAGVGALATLLIFHQELKNRFIRVRLCVSAPS